MRIHLTTVAATAALMLLTGQAGAQEGVLPSARAATSGPPVSSPVQRHQPLTAAGAEDMEPMPLPLVEPPDDAELDQTFEPLLRPLEQGGPTAPEGQPGQPPSIEIGPLETEEDLLEEEYPIDSEVPWDDSMATEPDAAPDRFNPLAASPDGAQYTTTRVFPFEAIVSFPHSTIGRIEGRDPVSGGGVSCSGAVINQRLVLTAGHCVFDPVTDTWMTAVSFIPAYERGLTPYGRWPAQRMWTTGSWFSGNGTVPNHGDFAILEISDQPIAGAVRKIGEAVGWLGWQARSPVAHVGLFGYPSNLDGTEKVQHTGTSTFGIWRDRNVALYGSNMSSGASGGPIVMNFGVAATGQDQGRAPPNRIIGVISFETVGREQLGSSIPDDEFVQLVQAACRGRPGNCR